jgi:hypothetical protein
MLLPPTLSTLKTIESHFVHIALRLVIFSLNHIQLGGISCVIVDLLFTMLASGTKQALTVDVTSNLLQRTV